MNNPLISVVTACYNSAETIRDTLDAMLSQTYDHFEYIVIDGQSKDDTVAIVESYRSAFETKGVTLTVVSERDNGIYDAMNKGIRLAKGEIIGIVNSDDYYMPYTLAEVAAFDAEQNFDIMYADLRVFGVGREFIKRSKPLKNFDTRFWNHPTTFVKKAVYDKRMYACESMYDDLDFILYARESGYKICILNKILSNFRLGGVSNERSLQKVRARLALRNSIFKRHGCHHYRLKNAIMEYGKYLLG